MDTELLLANAQTFAQTVRDCFRDMLGTEIVLDGQASHHGRFAPSHPMIVMIHFTGPVQGEYVLSLTEATAAGLLGAWQEGMSQEDLKALRGDFSGMLKEILNTAVGAAIPHLEAQFDRLTYHPPMMVYGEMEYPEVPCGSLTLCAEAGDIECSFILDLAGTEAERMLVRAMDDLRQAKHQVESCTKVLQSLVEKPPEGNNMRQIVEEARQLLSEFVPAGSDPTTQGRW
jgi:CheY-specific phosphatase CheX